MLRFQIREGAERHRTELDELRASLAADACAARAARTSADLQLEEAKLELQLERERCQGATKKAADLQRALSRAQASQLGLESSLAAAAAKAAELRLASDAQEKEHADRLAASAEQRAALEVRLDALQRARAEEAAGLEGLRADLAAKEGLLRQAEASLAASERERSDYRAFQEAHGSEVADLTEQVARLRGRCGALEERLAASGAAEAARRREVLALEERAAELKAQLAGSCAALQRSEQGFKDATASLQRTRHAAAANHAAALASAANERRARISEVRSLEEQLASAANERRSRISEVRSLEEQLSAQEALARTFAAATGEAGSLCRTAQTSLDGAKAELSRERAARAWLSSRLSDAERRVASLQRAAEESLSSRAATERSLRESFQRLRSLEAADGAASAREQELRRLRRQVAAAACAAHKWRRSAKSAVEALEEARRAASAPEGAAALEEVRRRAAALEDMVRVLREEMAAAVSRAKAAQAEAQRSDTERVAASAAFRARRAALEGERDALAEALRRERRERREEAPRPHKQAAYAAALRAARARNEALSGRVEEMCAAVRALEAALRATGDGAREDLKRVEGERRALEAALQRERGLVRELTQNCAAILQASKVLRQRCGDLEAIQAPLAAERSDWWEVSSCSSSDAEGAAARAALPVDDALDLIEAEAVALNAGVGERRRDAAGAASAEGAARPC